MAAAAALGLLRELSGLLGHVELEMQVKKIRNENSVPLQEAVEPHYIRYIVAKD